MIFSERVDELDVRFVTWVHEHTPDWLVDAMRVLTHLGGAWVLVPLAIVAVVVLLRLGRPWAAVFVGGALTISQLLVQLLKYAIRRDRPTLDDPFLELSTYSFPSGHAFSSTAFYGSVALVLAASVERAHRVAIFATAAAIVAVVAASRVILGVHYLLDVLAGIAGGIAVVAALLLVLEPQTRR